MKAKATAKAKEPPRYLSATQATQNRNQAIGGANAEAVTAKGAPNRPEAKAKPKANAQQAKAGAERQDNNAKAKAKAKTKAKAAVDTQGAQLPAVYPQPRPKTWNQRLRGENAALPKPKPGSTVQGKAKAKGKANAPSVASTATSPAVTPRSRIESSSLDPPEHHASPMSELQAANVDENEHQNGFFPASRPLNDTLSSITSKAEEVVPRSAGAAAATIEKKTFMTTKMSDDESSSSSDAIIKASPRGLATHISPAASLRSSVASPSAASSGHSEVHEPVFQQTASTRRRSFLSDDEESDAMSRSNSDNVTQSYNAAQFAAAASEPPPYRIRVSAASDTSPVRRDTSPGQQRSIIIDQDAGGRPKRNLFRSKTDFEVYVVPPMDREVTVPERSVGGASPVESVGAIEAVHESQDEGSSINIGSPYKDIVQHSDPELSPKEEVRKVIASSQVNEGEGISEALLLAQLAEMKRHQQSIEDLLQNEKQKHAQEVASLEQRAQDLVDAIADEPRLRELAKQERENAMASRLSSSEREWQIQIASLQLELAALIPQVAEYDKPLDQLPMCTDKPLDPPSCPQSPPSHPPSCPQSPPSRTLQKTDRLVTSYADHSRIYEDNTQTGVEKYLCHVYGKACETPRQCTRFQANVVSTAPPHSTGQPVMISMPGSPMKEAAHLVLKARPASPTRLGRGAPWVATNAISPPRNCVELSASPSSICLASVSAASSPRANASSMVSMSHTLGQSAAATTELARPLAPPLAIVPGRTASGPQSTSAMGSLPGGLVGQHQRTGACQSSLCGSAIVNNVVVARPDSRARSLTPTLQRVAPSSSSRTSPERCVSLESPLHGAAKRFPISPERYLVRSRCRLTSAHTPLTHNVIPAQLSGGQPETIACHRALGVRSTLATSSTSSPISPVQQPLKSLCVPNTQRRVLTPTRSVREGELVAGQIRTAQDMLEEALRLADDHELLVDAVLVCQLFVKYLDTQSIRRLGAAEERLRCQLDENLTGDSGALALEAENRDQIWPKLLRAFKRCVMLGMTDLKAYQLAKEKAEVLQLSFRSYVDPSLIEHFQHLVDDAPSPRVLVERVIELQDNERRVGYLLRRAYLMRHCHHGGKANVIQIQVRSQDYRWARPLGLCKEPVDCRHNEFYIFRFTSMQNVSAGSGGTVDLGPCGHGVYLAESVKNARQLDMRMGTMRCEDASGQTAVVVCRAFCGRIRDIGYRSPSDPLPVLSTHWWGLPAEQDPETQHNFHHSIMWTTVDTLSGASPSAPREFALPSDQVLPEFVVICRELDAPSRHTPPAPPAAAMPATQDSGSRSGHPNGEFYGCVTPKGASTSPRNDVITPRGPQHHSTSRVLKFAADSNSSIFEETGERSQQSTLSR